ncbi:ABC transporter substrate-binding protein [Hydrogenophaga sp. 5NK40-0174]|uniref:ABC transporter substrate-binding protein n=1 Tax=Hydrogenophaga sp. 5NK40-0174 TaxID=3127649 RepID=UPI003102C5D9
MAGGLLAALGAVEVASLASAASRWSRNISIATVDPSSFSELPLVLAQRLGFFADEGLSVQLVQAQSHAHAVGLLRRGQVQVISSRFSDLLINRANSDYRGIARRESLQSFVVQGRSPSMLLGAKATAVGADGEMDWRGKTVAVAALGSDAHRLARYLVDRQQTVQGRRGPATQYKAIASPSSAMAAFQSGQVDAICYPDPVATLFERRGTMRILADLRTTDGCKAALGGLVATGCLIASARTIEASPAVCQGLTNGVVRALRWIQTAGPLDVVKTVPESYFGGDRGVYLAAFVRSRQAWSNDGAMPPDAALTLAKVMARTEVSLPVQRLALDSTFTNLFAEKAMELVRS